MHVMMRPLLCCWLLVLVKVPSASGASVDEALSSLSADLSRIADHDENEKRYHPKDAEPTSSEMFARRSGQPKPDRKCRYAFSKGIMGLFTDDFLTLAG